jgi:hypothetical protein
MEFVHVLAILIALLSGVYTGTLGWKRYQFKRGRAAASGFNWQKHIRWGRRFYLLLWLGFLLGFVSRYAEHRKIFGAGLHAYLALFILSLFSMGIYLGVRLSRGKGSDRLASVHMGINYITYFFVLFQAILGVILLTLS